MLTTEKAHAESVRQEACPGAIARVLRGDLDTLLSREWLITNGRGGYASGTVIGCPTRRYHAHLIGARRPPLERYAMLSRTMARVRFDQRAYKLATTEFANGFHPPAYRLLRDFEHHPAGPNPWVRWTYRMDEGDVREQVTLLTGTELALIRYEVTATDDREIELEVSPLAVLRDFHGLRSQTTPADWDQQSFAGGLWVQDRAQPQLTLLIFPVESAGNDQPTYEFSDERFDGVHYRVEAALGYPSTENHHRLGCFKVQGRRNVTVELAAGAFYLGPEQAVKALERALRPPPAGRAAASDGQVGGAVFKRPTYGQRRLLDAADQFIVERAGATGRGRATIMAGYPWFGDWGRDAFIALEGLLLIPRRFTEARQVLETFAGAQRNGLIPNLFDDYGGECHYNSMDASLWFIHAADRYLELSGDAKAWSAFLAKACTAVVEAYEAGTDFNIGLDTLGLVRGGHEKVQLTWMDAKCGEVVFTPRHGRPVEVNALWYHALRILEQRCAASNGKFAERCGRWADRVAESFSRVFWRDDGRGLYDVIRDDGADAAIRPNQIFAVSLANSPLTPGQQRTVLNVVNEKLLTTCGLRSLAPGEPGYKGRYEGNLFERDGAYHQGTVWAWLMGPYAEAFLRVHEFSNRAKTHARTLVEPLLRRLDEAGLGSVSEIFDGDSPHRPRGCIAQAWSVAELIRILRLVE